MICSDKTVTNIKIALIMVTESPNERPPDTQNQDRPHKLHFTPTISFIRQNSSQNCQHVHCTTFCIICQEFIRHLTSNYAMSYIVIYDPISDFQSF